MSTHSGTIDDDTAGSLEIRLLGGFALYREGVRLPLPRTRKGQSVLALLVLRKGQPVERAFLAETLWPGSTESQALENLRTSLKNLRHILQQDKDRLQGPTLHTLTFDLNGVDCDVITFDALLAKGDQPSLEQAVALYRGRLLEGSDAEWLLSEREMREQGLLRALERRAQHALTHQDSAMAVAHLRRVISIDPLRESAWRLLMQAHAMAGETAAVIAVYKELEKRLKETLGAQPDPETTALCHRLRDPQRPARNGTHEMPQEVAPRPPARLPIARPSTLPEPLDGLIGREKEIGELADLLSHYRLVTLKGPGGSGKTRLAIAAGEQLARRFSGNVWFVSLAELLEASRLPETIRDVLHLPNDKPDPFRQIVNRLSMHPSFLILDNFEHLTEDGAPFVGELLHAVPTLRCLVTSRRSLRLPGEREYLAAPLSLPEEDEPAHPLDFTAIRLFVERASARRSEFTLNDDNTAATVALCRKLEGMPLAIELVAAWANLLTPQQMRERLDARFAFPTGPNRGIPDRHRSLQRAFDGTYDLLDAAERALLRRLSVFSGGWTLEAAEYVCRDEDDMLPFKLRFDEIPVLVMLQRLVDKSLVVFYPGDETGMVPRYRLLEVTRQYAHERMSDEEREATERRHAEYYFEEAMRREEDSLINERTQLRDVLPDRENYLRALRWWEAVDAEKALRLMIAAEVIGVSPLSKAEQSRWMDRLETQPLPPATLLNVMLYARAIHWGQGRVTLEAVLEKGFVLAEQCGDLAWMARLMDWLGERAMLLGVPVRSRELLEKAGEYARLANIPLLVGNVQAHLVDLSVAEGNAEAAWEQAKALLDYGRAHGPWSTVHRGFVWLGFIARNRGEYDSARNYLEQSLVVCPQSEYQARGGTLRYLGGTAFRQGDYTAARTFFLQSAQVCREGRRYAHEAWAYVGLFQTADRQGNRAEGLGWLMRAMQIFERVEETGSLVVCMRRLAEHFIDLPEKAAFYWFVCAHYLEEHSHEFDVTRQNEMRASIPFVEQSLSEERLAAIRQRARSLSIGEAVRLAYEEMVDLIRAGSNP